MKKFIKKCMFFLAFCAITATVPSYLIDPYNVFHWKNIRCNGIAANKNYIKTKYILNNPDKFENFLFGSSRVGAIHVENIENEKIYNMTYNSSTPSEYYQSIRTFIEGNVHINSLYIGVDSLSYTINSDEHDGSYMLASYQYLQKPFNFVKMYLLKPSVALKSLHTTPKIYNKSEIDDFYDYGWGYDYDEEAINNWDDVKYSSSYLMDETLQDIRNIKDLCDANGIKLIVFTNPMYKTTYEASVDNINYLEFLERLADITDYYNFSSSNDITNDSKNYIDASHYNAYTGDMIIDAIFKSKVDSRLYEQGFGWYVTKDNVNKLLDLLENQR